MLRRRRFDKKYWATYKVLDILQKVFYRSNPAREAFVEMCESDYVQKMTFDSYLYKTVVPGNPLDDIKLLVEVRWHMCSPATLLYSMQYHPSSDHILRRGLYASLAPVT